MRKCFIIGCELVILIIGGILIVGCAEFQRKQLSEEQIRIAREESRMAQEEFRIAESFYESGEFDKAVVCTITLLEKYNQSQMQEEGRQLLERIAIAKKLLDGAQDKKIGVKALDKMEVSVDEVEGITWLKDKTSTLNRYSKDMWYTYRNTDKAATTMDVAEHFYLYTGKSEKGSPWLRLKIGYASECSAWLFINSYIIKADGKRFDLSAEKVKRDVVSGVFSRESYEEKLDIFVETNIYEMIKAVIGSEKTILRCSGENNTYDREITQEEKTALQNVLDAYKVLGGK